MRGRIDAERNWRPGELSLGGFESYVRSMRYGAQGQVESPMHGLERQAALIQKGFEGQVESI